MNINLPDDISNSLSEVCMERNIDINKFVIDLVSEEIEKFKSKSPLVVGNREIYVAGYKPLQEQSEIIDLVKRGEPVVLSGPAGTSKTSVLTALSLTLPSFKYGVLFTSSNEEKKHLRRKFLRNIELVSQFSYPYRALASNYKEKPKFYLTTSDIEAICYLDLKPETKDQIYRSTIKTLERFSRTREPSISSHHLVLPKFIKKDRKERLAALILDTSQKYWEKITLGGNISVTYSILMKLWHATKPVINSDIIFVDNVHNLHPLLVDIIMMQKLPKLLAYDEFMNQAEVESIDWAQYKNAHLVQLRNSYRFDEESIKITNTVLKKFLKAPAAKCLKKPFKEIEEKLACGKSAIICYGLKGVIRECFRAVNTGQRFHVLDCLDGFYSYLESSISKPNRSNDSLSYKSSLYQEIIDLFGERSLLKLIPLIQRSSLEVANTLITTAKTSAYFEFDNVTLSDDFISPSDPNYTLQDGVYLYVAVSRHRFKINIKECNALNI
ncbi:hypothetical protein [Pseudoalteromonas galatheae]|uniref:hypothetical protein n=1 Tax=Pseudoalteromonas galatheae TaxID=579562 RepID=UPI0030CC90C8